MEPNPKMVGESNDQLGNSLDFRNTNEPKHSDPIVRLQAEAERRAWAEEWQDRRRRIVTDWSRIQRRARAFEEKLAPEMLSPKELNSWRHWRSLKFAPGSAMRKGILAERRLAPEATTFEGRMDAVLLKHANLPIGDAGKLVMCQYWELLDVAAEAVEQAAYPGTNEARKRYALAFRRCARELRDTQTCDEGVPAQALRRAQGTLQLSLDDGTLGLWASSQALIDFVGLKADGESQYVSQVTSAGWDFIWKYAVSSRLRQVSSERFASVADNREYRANEAGRLLDETGQPLVWTWDGMGSGMLGGNAAPNTNAESALQAAIDETGASRVLSAPNWTDIYEKSPEYRALRLKARTLYEGTESALCEALADVLDRGLRAVAPKFVTPLKWDEMSDEDFERVVFSLVSSAAGYGNPKWLTQTRAPDRGRDLSAIRTVSDSLNGDRYLRVIFQCKHWRSRSVGVDEVTKLVVQMSLWAPPPVDELIIVTSGRFSSDAVQWIEKHNEERESPWIGMWPNSHLELLSCS
jgi:hypothetical protein